MIARLGQVLMNPVHFALAAAGAPAAALAAAAALSAAVPHPGTAPGPVVAEAALSAVVATALLPSKGTEEPRDPPKTIQEAAEAHASHLCLPAAGNSKR